MNPPRNPSSVRPGFSLVEVTLAIGIVGVAILSLVGILGSTFQQVDEIMQTNRALSGVTRLIGALDNPRSIVYLDAAGEKEPNNSKYLMDAGLALDGGNPSVSNFDIAYRLLQGSSEQLDLAWQWPINDLWGGGDRETETAWTRTRGQGLGPDRRHSVVG